MKIADVARIAGVSVATVSRVIARPDIVTPTTRDRVEAAIARTGYAPNPAARSLRARRTMMVLVVVPNIANTFFSEVLRGIDAALSRAGYGLIIANLDDSPEKEARYVDLALAGQVDGILLLCGHVPTSPGRDLAASGVPLVAACEAIADGAFPQVEIDNRASAARATAHLAGLGHRRIAYLSGPPRNVLDHARRQGYRDALAAAGIPPDAELMLEGDFTFRSGVAAAATVLARPAAARPTAIFAANDEMAIGFMKTLQGSGLVVPDDFSVVGFDAIDYAEFCNPALTTVSQPRRDLGFAAAELLVGEMNGSKGVPRLRRMEARLVVRDSSAAPPAAHPSRGGSAPRA